MMQRTSFAYLVQEKMDFLRGDLTHLFDDQGIDQSAYDDKVNFEDPITKYSTVKGAYLLLNHVCFAKQESNVVTVCCRHMAIYSMLCVTGYMFNISMLRRVFAPTFQLHDIKQTSEYDITTRWTMSMQLALNKYNPFRKWWDPQLLFTGTSIMSVNPSTGNFSSKSPPVLQLWNNLLFPFSSELSAILVRIALQAVLIAMLTHGMPSKTKSISVLKLSDTLLDNLPPFHKHQS